MWSSCFNPGSVAESAHSLGSTASLPAPDTPMLSAHSLLSAHSSKSLQQLPPEAPASEDGGSGSGSGSESGSDMSGLDAVMSDSPRAASSKALYGPEHGEPDCQLVGQGWKLWAHKNVLKSEWLDPLPIGPLKLSAVLAGVLAGVLASALTCNDASAWLPPCKRPEPVWYHSAISVLHGKASFIVLLAAAAVAAAGRAAHFRARISSGMRDAHDTEHKVSRKALGEQQHTNTASVSTVAHASLWVGSPVPCQ